MRIKSLRVGRLPGIRDPFEITDFSPGLNLVIGPNASGKTSLCRAFRSLIWHEAEKMDHASVSAEMAADDRSLRVEREGNATHWSTSGDQSAGESIVRPSLPESHLAKCFTVEVDDLIAADGGDEDLAHEVLRHIAGGYDLRSLLASDDYRIKKTFGVEEGRAVDHARGALAGVRAEHLSIRDSETRLSELESRKESAGSARDELRRLEMSLDLVRARTERVIADEALAEFDPAMAKLEGNEMSLVSELRREVSAKLEASEDRQVAIDHAHERIEAANLPEEGLDSVSFAKHLSGIEELRDCEATLRNQEQMLHDADTQVERAKASLGNKDLSTTCIDDSVLRRAEAYLKQVDALAQRRANLESRIQLLTDDREGVALSVLREGILSLRAWMSSPRPALGYIRKMRILAAAIAVCGASVAAVAAVFVHPMHWIVAALAIIIGLGMVFMSDRESRLALDRERSRFMATDLQAPSDWSEESVPRRLRELERDLAAGELQAEKAAEARALQSEAKELESAEAGLCAERRRLLADTGLDLAISNLGLVLLTRNLADLQDAALERDQMRRRCAELNSEITSTRVKLLEFLAEYGEDCQSDASAIYLHSEHLRERASEWSASKLQLRDALAEKGRLQKDLDRLAEKEAWVFSSLGLSSGDDQPLTGYLSRLADYQQASATSAQARLNEKICSEKLGSPESLPTEEQLLVEIEGCRDLAASHETLVEEIAEIRLRIDAAKKGEAMAEAIKAVDDARTALADRLDEAALATAGRFLISGVEEQHAKEARPEILEQAAGLFAEFTNHQFELNLADGWGGQPARFIAVETSSNRRRKLTELSTGTRSQLLIAVRLAFAMRAERGESLPFFLDDVLSTTDPARCEKIVENLREFAEKDGRQIIYLTSNPADLGAWSKAADIHVIDLAEVRALDRAIEAEADLEVPALPEVLLPRNLSPAEYATAIRVPPFRPLREASEVHLFYLLRHDLDLLHRVLRDRVEFMGPLRSLLAGGQGPRDLSSEDRSQIEALIELTLCFNRAWRVGRGPAVDRKILREAGVSERFLNDFAAIADESGGSADKLIQVIEERQDARVKGFRKDKLLELRTALLGSGHLDQRPKLSEDEIRAELLRALEPAINGGSISNSAVIQRVHELVHLAQRN